MVKHIVLESKGMAVVAKKRGRITIPLALHKKYNIETDTALLTVKTEEGILLKPVHSIWDMVGCIRR